MHCTHFLAPLVRFDRPRAGFRPQHACIVAVLIERTIGGKFLKFAGGVRFLKAGLVNRLAPVPHGDAVGLFQKKDAM